MFNFKKDTVFSRVKNDNTTDENASGVLAVWGSPSSGKTTTAIKIAHHLFRETPHN